jgi:hypothetical protein
MYLHRVALPPWLPRSMHRITFFASINFNKRHACIV